MKKDLKDVNYLFYNKFIRHLNREKIDLTENLLCIEKKMRIDLDLMSYCDSNSTKSKL